MPSPSAIAELVTRIKDSDDWNDRIQSIRLIPEYFGERDQRQIYALIAETVYKPNLTPQLAYIQWTGTYELDHFRLVYQRAFELTKGFERVDVESLVEVLGMAPETLRVFRTVIGYTPSEFASAASETASDLGHRKVSAARINSMERGRKPSTSVLGVLGTAIDQLMSRERWQYPPGDFRSKLDKPEPRGTASWPFRQQRSSLPPEWR